MFNKMLLATAAVIVTVAGASAADLPSKKAAPATYVKICDTYGAGFFYIPGSDTCLKVGGRVRYDLGYMPKNNYYGVSATANKDGKKDQSVQDTWGQHVRGRVTLDARTPSDFGTVRTFINLRLSQDTGWMTGVKPPMDNVSAKDYLAAKYSNPSIEAAFVQFAGFTAGRAPEVFAGDWFGNMMGYQHFPSFATGVVGLSYTAILGGGLSATVGIEDNNGFDAQNVTVESFAAPYQTPYDSLPLVVGKVSWDQSWGQIQVSGATAQNRSVLLASSTVGFTTGDYNITKTGYAFGGQLTLNADMIAKGDKFFLLGGMSSGINKLGYRIASKDSEARGVDGTGQSYINFTCNATGTVCDNTKSTYANVSFLHYWTPSIRQNLTAGVAMVDPGMIARAASAATQKATFTQLGTNVFWSPVKGLDIGLEVMYDRASVGNIVADNASKSGCNNITNRTPGCSASGDNIITRFRVQRDF